MVGKDNRSMRMSVVNVHKKNLVDDGYDDLIDWLKAENHIYIGRDMSFYVPGAIGSIWKNPFRVTNNEKPNIKIKKSKMPNTILSKGKLRSSKKYTLDESLREYRKYIISNASLMSQLHTLKGRVLGCWCKPNKCHGDVLLDLINTYC